MKKYLGQICMTSHGILFNAIYSYNPISWLCLVEIWVEREKKQQNKQVSWKD